MNPELDNRGIRLLLVTQQQQRIADPTFQASG
jgi:hypothetical protein